MCLVNIPTKKSQHFILLFLVCVCVCVCVLVIQLYLTLHNPMDYSLPGSTVHGIHQARILEWVVIPFSRRSIGSRNWTQVFCTAGGLLTVWATRDSQFMVWNHLKTINSNAWWIYKRVIKNKWSKIKSVILTCSADNLNQWIAELCWTQYFSILYLILPKMLYCSYYYSQMRKLEV